MKNGVTRGLDSNNDLGETIVLLENVVREIKCLIDEGVDVSDTLIEKMLTPLLYDEAEGVLNKIPCLLQRYSTEATFEATKKVYDIPAQQYSKNVICGQKNGVIALLYSSHVQFALGRVQAVTPMDTTMC